MIASPEYNGLMTPVLLNALTWASRGNPQGQMYVCFKGKIAMVVAAAPGPLGGMRGLRPMHELLNNLGMNTIPESCTVGSAYKAFNEDGSLIDERTAKMLETGCAQLFYASRGIANRDATCKIMEAVKTGSTVGEYGELSIT